MIRILLAADSELLHPRLRSVISDIPHSDLVGDVTDEHQIVESVRETRPDIVVVSFPSLGQFTTRLVPILRNIHPGVAIIALTTAFNQVDEDAWREAGASYVFNLTVQFDQFLDCLTTFSQAGLVQGASRLNGGTPDNEIEKKEMR